MGFQILCEGHAQEEENEIQTTVLVVAVITLSNIGNSALNLVHTVPLISSMVPGSCLANWLQGNASISSPMTNLQPHIL